MYKIPLKTLPTVKIHTKYKQSRYICMIILMILRSDEAGSFEVSESDHAAADFFLQAI
jgi:hypothetical protein